MGILFDPDSCGANLLHAITVLPKLSNSMRLDQFELSAETFHEQLLISSGNVTSPTDSIYEVY